MVELWLDETVVGLCKVVFPAPPWGEATSRGTRKVFKKLGTESKVFTVYIVCSELVLIPAGWSETINFQSVVHVTARLR